MIALIQRVTRASVEVDGRCVGAIDGGILALIGVQPADDEAAAVRLLERILVYRIFPDAEQRMNRSLADTRGGLLLAATHVPLGLKEPRRLHLGAAQ